MRPRPRHVVQLLLTAALGIALVACDRRPRVVDAELKEDLVGEIESRLAKRAYAHGADWSRWHEHVAVHRARIDAAATEAQLGSALNAALDEFGVSHLWVWTPEDMRIREAGRQAGLGLKTVSVDEGRLVTMVIQSGPAEAAGIRVGDVVLHRAETPPALGRGPIGERRTLSIARGDTTLEVAVTLAEHPCANPATLRWVRDGIALITVPSFSRSFYESRPLYLEGTIQAFFDEAAVATGIILDLRSNGGGYSVFVEHLAGMFMDPATPTYHILHAEEHAAFLDQGGDPGASLLEMARRNGQVIRAMRVKSRTPYGGPIVVLVDERSGSGGETLPAMVQAAGRGTLIGSHTAGTVLSGDSARLAGGYELFYPQAESVMPDGVRIEGNGVTPDIELTPRQTADDEFILKLAVDALLKS